MENYYGHKGILRRIAHKAMVRRGLLTGFSRRALDELGMINSPASAAANQVLDLRDLLWASIDNDDSRDLDQLTAAERLDRNRTKILVAIADVDALVKKGSAIDAHARHNTTSVYTPAVIFPMLPEKLSTGLTSLNYEDDRLAIIMEITVDESGSARDPAIYAALVRNHAKLAYHSVAGWLDGRTPVPEQVAAVPGLEENLRLQDQAAQRMKGLRHRHGALTLQTIEANPRFEAEMIVDLEAVKKDRANDLIEDFMIAANSAASHYLSSKGLPVLRRVVRTPKDWGRIIELASESGHKLPESPDARALEEFLIRARAADPLRFPDLSLSIIKLLGPGEYVAGFPGDGPAGHFSLAVKSYSHSTAPNRRFPDLITQRLLKTALSGEPAPYGRGELDELARHCTEEEDAVRKVERQVSKSAAALLLESRIGERFDAIVTGAAPKGTWVRLLHPPVEGKLVSGFEGMRIGERLSVQLIHADVESGFIDFKRI